MRSERVCSLARYLISLPQVQYELFLICKRVLFFVLMMELLWVQRKARESN
jgi:hypothetical protein